MKSDEVVEGVQYMGYGAKGKRDVTGRDRLFMGGYKKEDPVISIFLHELK